jgi:hypothetical protein
MATKSLFAMTLLLVGSQSLTACTIVDATDNADAGGRDQDAAPNDDTTNDDTTNDDTTNESDDTDGEDEDSGAASDDTNQSDDTDGEDGGTPTTSDTEDEGDAGDGEAPGEDAGGEETSDSQDGGASTGDTVLKHGSITLNQTAITAGEVQVVTGSASAGFSISTFDATTDAPIVDSNCDTTTVGSCSLLECDLFTGDAGAGDDSNGSSRTVGAGTIKITGLLEDLELEFDNTSGYQPAIGTSRWWSGGEEVTASAPGTDDVPEFSIGLNAPAAVSLTSPTISLLEALNVSRSDGIELVWEGGETGTVTLQVIDSTATASRMITCSVDADSGGVVVDGSLLEDFSDAGALTLTSVGTTAKTVDDWSLTFSANAVIASSQVAFEE